jgi:VanZ family protein
VFRPIINWLLVATWMIFIFLGSTNLLSSSHTSRFLGPFLRWLNPSISEAQLREAQYFIRKCGHVSEYAVLSVLVWNARRVASGHERRTFWQCAKFALLVSAFYAGTDELHQAFVPSRESSVMDVVIDTCGAGFGLLLLWLIGRWRKIWE